MKNLKDQKPVKIDSQTTIFVDKSIPDAIARQSYLERCKKTAEDSKRQINGSNNRKKPEYNEEEVISYDLDEFENLDD
jgi:hypothetical protein